MEELTTHPESDDEIGRLIAAGFDLCDDLDRPDEHCDCGKCKAYYDALPKEPA